MKFIQKKKHFDEIKKNDFLIRGEVLCIVVDLGETLLHRHDYIVIREVLTGILIGKRFREHWYDSIDKITVWELKQ